MLSRWLWPQISAVILGPFLLREYRVSDVLRGWVSVDLVGWRVIMCESKNYVQFGCKRTSLCSLSDEQLEIDCVNKWGVWSKRLRVFALHLVVHVRLNLMVCLGCNFLTRSGCVMRRLFVGAVSFWDLCVIIYSVDVVSEIYSLIVVDVSYSVKQWIQVFSFLKYSDLLIYYS